MENKSCYNNPSHCCNNKNHSEKKFKINKEYERFIQNNGIRNLFYIFFECLCR